VCPFVHVSLFFFYKKKICERDWTEKKNNYVYRKKQFRERVVSKRDKKNNDKQTKNFANTSECLGIILNKKILARKQKHTHTFSRTPKGGTIFFFLAVQHNENNKKKKE